jgi:hypothetical protein
MEQKDNIAQFMQEVLQAFKGLSDAEECLSEEALEADLLNIGIAREKIAHAKRHLMEVLQRDPQRLREALR